MKFFKFVLILLIFMCLVACQKKAPQKPVSENNSTTSVPSQRINEFVHWYPAMEQAKMRDAWLSKYTPGQWQFTGKVTAADRTVVTPQADVNYGYSWFNISNQPLLITMPRYKNYYSLSVFDMHHFMEVYVKPERPVVIRLPHQKSPVANAHEIVLQTYQGVALTRQAIVNNEEEVMQLAKEITISGGGGDFPFIIPEFTEEERTAGMKAIRDYMPRVKGGAQLFGAPYEGVGDMDRATGVNIGQLGTQARYANYRLYNSDNSDAPLKGSGAYEITVPKTGMTKNDLGYWSLTVYNQSDKYLIKNPKNSYHVSSYDAEKNEDGTVTIQISPNGEGKNAIPTANQDWYCVLRVYEPMEGIQFPELVKK